MKTLVALVLMLPMIGWAQTQHWSLESPDRTCFITILLNGSGRLSYEVRRRGKPMLLESPLGLRRDDQPFVEGLSLVDADRVERRQHNYELFSGNNSHVEHTLQYRSLVFRNANQARLILDLAASNEGVAFRYRFDEHSTNVHVLEAELTGFAVDPATRGWLQPYHAAGPYTPAYEDFYFPVSPGQPPPESRARPVGWAFPALFQPPHRAGWMLLTESGTDASFCGCHLASDSAGGLYRLAFPAADEATKGQTNSVGPEPRWTLPWSMPWRVIVLGESAGAIAMATLVTDLAAPCALNDTTWIHPGRASWGWWSQKGPPTAELFNAFSDFGARMGWEYTLFDAGWHRAGLENVASHAIKDGLMPLTWHFAGDFYTPAGRKKQLDEVQAAGVRGVKVDFWCSDRQEAIGAMQALFADAATRHLVVNLHGCTIPRGWQRTWPNLLTMEAVLGRESYKFDAQYTEKAAELDTVLPFTRNAIGPMDITPVGCSPEKYQRTTTAAHELASALVFTSGIIHYADKPEFFDSLPEAAQQVLRDAPARWEQTCCLLGEPGRVVVFARRAGKSWFIAGLNGTNSGLGVELDLSSFEGLARRTLIAEGKEPLMQVSVVKVPASARWKHQMPARGGFVLRVEQ